MKMSLVWLLPDLPAPSGVMCGLLKLQDISSERTLVTFVEAEDDEANDFRNTLHHSYLMRKVIHLSNIL